MMETIGSSLKLKLQTLLDKNSSGIKETTFLRDALYHKDSVLKTSKYEGALAILSLCGWEVSSDINTEESTCKRKAESSQMSILTCKMCNAQVGVWNFDKQAERPLHLEYLYWKHSGTKVHSIARTPKKLSMCSSASGYTCLTSPLYVASSQMLNLCKTIAGGNLRVAAQQEGAKEEEEVDMSEERQVAKKQKIDLNVKSPTFYRSVAFNPLKGHRSYCPWIFSNKNNAEITPGWIQCLEALEPTEVSSPFESETHDQFTVPTDIVNMIKKVQRAIPG